MNKTGIIILMSLTLVCKGVAQREMTLEQCKEMAAKNNKKMRLSQCQTEAAKEQKKEAFTNYFPKISATGLAFKANDDLMNGNVDLSGMESNMGSTLGPALANLGIDPASLPTSVKVSALNKGYMASVMAIQPVYAGGQIINGNKLANIGVEVAELQEKQACNEVNAKVEQYYYTLINLREKRHTLDTMDKQLTHILADVQNYLDAGLCERNDLLNVQLKQDELKSGMLKLDNGIKITRMLLAQQMGMDKDSFNISEGINSIMETPESQRVNTDSAVSNRTEYKLMDKNIEANALQTKIKRGGFLPTVAIGGTVFNHDLAKDLFGESSTGAMVFVSASVPISDWWGGSHAIRQMKQEGQIAMLQKEDGEEMLSIQIQQTYNEMEEAYNQLQVAQHSVTEAKENYRLNYDYYKAGTATLTDLLNAESAMQQTLDRQTEAMTTYLIKQGTYQRAIGN